MAPASGERVLVTGASGVVGGAAARALLAAGYAVSTLQRGPIGDDLRERGVREHRGDIADPDAVARALAGCDAVVHAAAKVDIVGPWAEFERANVEGTRVVIEASRPAGIERVVVVSSPSVAHAGRPLVGAGADPADPERARGHYARSKAMAERLALAASDDSLAVTAIRPHLVWGPGDTQLTERIVERARAGRLAIIGTGAALIDTTYLDNAGEAIAAAVARAGDDAVRGRAFVVSNGEPRTVGEMLRRIAAAAGAPGPRVTVPFPAALGAGRLLERAWPGEPPLTSFLAEQLAVAHWFDQRDTRRVLGWTPRIGLEEGFTRLEAWYAREATGGVAPPEDRSGTV